ncbi:hypothetical protein EOD29_00305 [Mesorhizobium sp. M1A.T.Ca.IN.004.03.1.1]|nr:hypothetical protein EOD29_00305 [Mesorhizobium sp. M1A.T.Ca.IN.004.03.1.1]
MTKLSDLGPPITGRQHGSEMSTQVDCFYACPVCGQVVDKRDLRQVIWHEQPGHQRLEMDA